MRRSATSAKMMKRSRLAVCLRESLMGAMLISKYQRILINALCIALVGLMFAGCAQQLQLPRIDPLGRSIFLPNNATTVVTPANQLPTPGIVVPGAVAGGTPVFAGQLGQQPIIQQPIIQQPVIQQPFQGQPLVNVPVRSGPAFTQPPAVPSCANGNCGASLGRPHIQPSGSLISHRGPINNALNRGKRGTLTTTPAKIVAPVGSEVVVLAGICGGDGYFVTNQPIEWMLSQDSAGQLVEVGGMEHSAFNRLISPSAKKFSGDYAWGRTALKEKLLTRGTDTPGDDMRVAKGQAYVTLTSGSAGTSYLTTVAPKTDAWPERKSITRIHWVDGVWSIPAPTSAAAGTVQPLNSVVTRSSDGTGVEGWKVKYQIVGGVPAEFGPDGTQTAEVTTNSQGQAPINIRQPAGQAVVGPTQVRVEVVRPGFGTGQSVPVESGITTVNWSAPALTIRAIGPRTAGINQPFNYRVEVTNPGDQVARGVKVSTEDIVDSLEYISSSPKPGQYGNRFEWELGDIQPGSQPKVIDIQMRADEKGPKQLCFEAASDSDNLTTEACAETTVAVPCIGLDIDGPTTGKTGDLLSYNFNVTNQCDRPLENVQIQLQYDPALVADGVPNPVQLNTIDRILPGETRNLPPLTFRAIRGGTHCFNMDIQTSAGDKSRARRCVEIENVNESKVRIDMQGERVVRLGDQAFVKMVVTNVGNVPLDDVTLLNAFSRSLEPARKTDFPQTWIGDDMAFSLGRIEPGESKTVEVKYDTLRADGDAFSRATVTTPFEEASDQTSIPIRIEPAGAGGFGNGGGFNNGGDNPGAANPGGAGVPGGSAGNLEVNVNAIDRRVAVNNNATFRVSVTNNRAIADQNIQITLLVPPGTNLQAPDPTQTGLRIIRQSDDGSIVTFEPRLEMRPGETLSFPITLQTRQQGQITFAVQANSARSPSNIEATDTVTVIP